MLTLDVSDYSVKIRVLFVIDHLLKFNIRLTVDLLDIEALESLFTLVLLQKILYTFNIIFKMRNNFRHTKQGFTPSKICIKVRVTPEDPQSKETSKIEIDKFQVSSFQI